MPLCPVCDKPIALETTPTAPFCSDRCRLVDLGRWLDESHAIPGKPRRPGGPLDDAQLDDAELDEDTDSARIAPDEPPDE
jgi:endogenous inhibitor of DNA gyrase (YacG/DUF329 family)